MKSMLEFIRSLIAPSLLPPGDNGDAGPDAGELDEGEVADALAAEEAETHDEPEGDGPDGGDPDGDAPDGGEPEGDAPDGDEPDGGDPDGDAPDGEELAWKEIPEGMRQKLQAVIDKRIGAVSRKRREAEARAVEAESQVQAVRGKLAAIETERIVPRETAENPLAGFVSEEKLGQLERHAQAVRAWAMRHPEGGACELMKGSDGKPVEVAAEQVREILIQTEEDLHSHIPARRQYLAQQSEYDRVAYDSFPQLKDPQSELSLAVSEIVRGLPEIKRLPGWRLGAVYYALGRQLVEKAGRDAFGVLNGINKKGGLSARGAPASKPAVKRGPVPAVRGTPARSKAPGPANAKRGVEGVSTEADAVEFIAASL